MSEVVDVPSSPFSAADAQEIWLRGVEALEGSLDPQIFAAYVKVLSFEGFENGAFIIGAPSKLVCSQVEQKFKGEIGTILGRELGIDCAAIRFTVRAALERVKPQTSSATRASLSAATADSLRSVRPTSPAPVVVRKIAAPVPSTDRSIGNSGTLFAAGRVQINPRYTFDTFVVGSSNQFCHAAALRVAEEPAKNYNPLFIYGGVGLGKTHLLHAIANAVLTRQPTAKVLYLSSETFTNELIQALRTGKMDAFKAALRNIDVLLIDDIQFMCGKERTQEEFFHTFNALYNAKKQIIITSDELPQDIPGLEERLQTRFSWGLTADLQAPDFETRVAILKRKALQERLAVPESVLHFIAERVSSNVRELEGALTRLQAASSLRGSEITLEFAESSLKPLFAPKVINLTVDDIKRAVADQFHIKVADMVSKRRTKNLSFPRHIAMYLCRKHTTLSYPEIGMNFGGRDHSSVIHASNVVATKISSDEEIGNLVSSIERRLLG